MNIFTGESNLPRRRFFPGRKYTITSQRAQGEKQHHLVESECEFEYLGREGKFHVFRETRGNWTRRYTDAQLTGKQVKEIKS